jgi:hypothetical protein
MTIFLQAPWNVEQEEGTVQTISIQVTGSGGSSSVYELTSGSFFTAFTASIEDIQYRNFLSDFATYLSYSNYGIWQTGYDFGTSTFFISCSQSGTLADGALFKFNSLASSILGMSNGINTSQKTYTSTIGPKYTWTSTLSDWSKISFPYEGRTIVKEERCTDGRVFAISNEDNVSWLSNIESNYTWFDWKFVYEDQSNIFSDFSSSLNPNTFEQFFKHVRSYQPFLVFGYNPPNSTKTTGSYSDRIGTFKIRADQSVFKSVQSINSYSELWDFDVKTRRLSTGSNSIGS